MVDLAAHPCTLFHMVMTALHVDKRGLLVQSNNEEDIEFAKRLVTAMAPLVNLVVHRTQAHAEFEKKNFEIHKDIHGCLANG